MTEPEDQPEMSGDPLVEDLLIEVQSLRTLLTVSLIVLLVFAICMNAFLGIQISQLNKNRDQAQQGAVAAQAQANDIWRKLNEFSRSNADVAPILDHYRQYFTNQPAAATSAPAAARPVAPAAPKK